MIASRHRNFLSLPLSLSTCTPCLFCFMLINYFPCRLHPNPTVKYQPTHGLHPLCESLRYSASFHHSMSAEANHLYRVFCEHTRLYCIGLRRSACPAPRGDKAGSIARPRSNTSPILPPPLWSSFSHPCQDQQNFHLTTTPTLLKSRDPRDQNSIPKKWNRIFRAPVNSIYPYISNTFILKKYRTEQQGSLHKGIRFYWVNLIPLSMKRFSSRFPRTDTSNAQRILDTQPN